MKITQLIFIKSIIFFGILHRYIIITLFKLFQFFRRDNQTRIFQIHARELRIQKIFKRRRTGVGIVRIDQKNFTAIAAPRRKNCVMFIKF